MRAEKRNKIIEEKYTYSPDAEIFDILEGGFLCFVRLK